MFNNHKTINCAIPHRTYSETTNPSCINSKIMFGFKYCSRSLRAHFSYYALYSFFVRFIHHKRKTKYQSIHINNRCAFGGLQNHAIIKKFQDHQGKSDRLKFTSVLYLIVSSIAQVLISCRICRVLDNLNILYNINIHITDKMDIYIYIHRNYYTAQMMISITY